VWSASDWQAGVKFVQPEFLDNYSGGNGYWEIQGFTFYDITDIDSVSAAVQTEATARASETGELFGQYSVKIDLAGNVAGYGLMSTSSQAEVVDWAAVASGIMQAITGSEPGLTLFNEVINGRKLGDTDGNGLLELTDSINILKYDANQSIPLAVTQYIEQTLEPILLGNLAKYFAYLTADSQAVSEFGIRADKFFIAPPSYVGSTAPSTNLYKGRVWVDTTNTPPTTRYYTGSDWSTIPQALPFVVQTSDSIEAPAGVYINTAFIKDATITSAKIATLAVTSGKIDSLAVTNAKIADLAVTNAKISDLAVSNAKISDLAVTSAKIDNLAVTSAKIDSLAVTSAKIANLAVNDLKIADNSVTLYSSFEGSVGLLPVNYLYQIYGNTGYVWIKPGQSVVVDIIFDQQFQYDPKFDAAPQSFIELRRTPAGGGTFDTILGSTITMTLAAPGIKQTSFISDGGSNVYLFFKRRESAPAVASFSYTNSEADDVAIQGYWLYAQWNLSQQMTLTRNFGRMFVRIK
jgi:hypothetical protein